MSQLPTEISIGDAGHIAHHEALHSAINGGGQYAEVGHEHSAEAITSGSFDLERMPGRVYSFYDKQVHGGGSWPATRPAGTVRMVWVGDTEPPAGILVAGDLRFIVESA